jgi:beta-lactamase regulating signal transducer with metallopeptidase domain
MIAIEQFWNGIDWHPTALTLFHSLWQGGVIAVGMWGALRFVPAAHAAARYRVALAGLWLAVIAAVGTYQYVDQGKPSAGGQAVASRNVILNSREVSASRIVQAPVAEQLAGNLPRRAMNLRDEHRLSMKPYWAVIAGVWMFGAFVMLLRAAFLVAGAGRMTGACRPVEDGQLLELIGSLRKAFGVSRVVRVMAGVGVGVPCVLGVLSPVILLPASIMNDLPLHQLRLILAHEMAHIRRHDFLVNLVQLLVEAVFFFNPAVWWLSHQIRIEREACCDAMAVRSAGSSEDYAGSLAQMMSRLLQARRGSQLAQAFSGKGGLLDRVRRVLVADYRPEVRMPWHSLTAVLVVIAILFMGMWRGTAVVVKAAEDLLTPAQRVEKMAELQKELGPHTGFGDSERGEAEKALLAGSIKTSDGRPLPKEANATIYSYRANGTAAYSVSIRKDGAFSMRVQRGILQIWAECPGYAPLASEPLKADAQGHFAPVKLVLSNGFEGRIKLTDRAGGVISNANASIEYVRKVGSHEGTFGAQSLTTDGEGIAVLPHASDAPARVKVNIDGFEQDAIPVQLKADEIGDVRLTAAEVTNGTVLDGESQQPISNATIVLIGRDGFESTTIYPDPAAAKSGLMGRTDEQGRFALRTLRKDSTYTLRVSAKSHASAIFQQIRPGQKDLVWRLGAAHPIEVELVADEGKMPKQLAMDNPLQLPGANYSSNVNVPVVLKDGVGHAVIADPLPGSISLSSGNKRLTVKTEEITGPLTFDLRDAGQPAPQAVREVIVKLMFAKDGPEPRGRLRIDYIKKENGNSYWPVMVPLTHGEARVKVPVPTTLRYEQGELAGYWIAEKSGIEIQEGTDALTLEVQAEPAGAIHGQVLDENGKPFVDRFYVSLMTVKPAEDAAGAQRANSLQPFTSGDGDPRFFVGPLPLAGTYRLLVNSQGRFKLSDEVTLDADHPMQAIDLKFAAGNTVQGRATGPDGQPLEGAHVVLNFTAGIGGGYSTNQASTDRDGRFSFLHVDPDAGEYTLNIAPTAHTHGVQMRRLAISDQPLNVQAGAGTSARGRIIDAESGKGIAGARVSLMPKDGASAEYSIPIETVTDHDGQFEAVGLEAIEYRVRVEDTYPPSAKILRDNAGKATGVEAHGDNGVLIRGGSSERTEITRIRSPFN